jgi:hypothetical protein
MLRRCAILATLLLVGTACRSSLEDEPDASIVGGRVCMVSTSGPCKDAETQQSYAWIQANVFAPSCTFTSCHDDSQPAGGLDLKTAGPSHAALIDAPSGIANGRKLVVAGQPKQSYLLMIMQQFPPEMMEPTPATPPPDAVGYMPQAAPPVCCQKLDAIDRWIAAGAMNN